MSTKLRIATLNVNWWIRPASLKDYIELIKNLNVDVLALQESQSDTVQRLVEQLNGMETINSKYKWSHSSKQLLGIANSIITRYPIIDLNILRWNRTEQGCKEKKEDRAAVMIKIQINDNKILSIMNTHLDHINESTRMLQIKYFMNNIMNNDKKQKYPDIICGDFNSIIYTDYTNEEWENISKTRKENEWELPMTDVMNHLISKSDNNGYCDTLQYVLKKQFYKDVYLKQLSNDEEKKDENMEFEELNKKIDLIKWKEYEKHKDELDFDLNKLFFEYFKKNWQYTSRYYTRIDYILVSNNLMHNVICSGFEDTMSGVFDEQLQIMHSNLTDHNLYWCDINI